MPRMYPASVRRQIVARLREGEPVAAVAVDTGICQATLFRWKHQALIDAGLVCQFGVSSSQRRNTDGQGEASGAANRSAGQRS